MGQGSAIAQAAADLLLVNENLLQVAHAIATARRALRIVKQNLAWAIAYNLSAVPLAAAGLVSPWVAALGMSLSSLAVVLNARRLASPERSA
jgi:Cu2+-exporting ATPase